MEHKELALSEVDETTNEDELERRKRNKENVQHLVNMKILKK